MHINATRNNCSMNSNYEIKLEKKHFYNFEDCGAKFKTKTWKSLRDYFFPSKAAIKLEGGDGDGKGGLLPFPSVTPPPSVQSVGLRAYHTCRSTLVSAVLWKSVRVFVINKFLI